MAAFAEMITCLVSVLGLLGALTAIWVTVMTRLGILEELLRQTSKQITETLDRHNARGDDFETRLRILEKHNIP